MGVKITEKQSEETKDKTVSFNKELVDKYGYFFAVVEAKILENSCVLFGANENTGVYSTSEKDNNIEQPADEVVEQEEPTEVTQPKENKNKLTFIKTKKK